MTAKIVKNLAYSFEQEGNTVSVVCSADVIDETDNTKTLKEKTIEVVTDADQWEFPDLYQEAVQVVRNWANSLPKETE